MSPLAKMTQNFQQGLSLIDQLIQGVESGTWCADIERQLDALHNECLAISEKYHAGEAADGH